MMRASSAEILKGDSVRLGSSLIPRSRKSPSSSGGIVLYHLGGYSGTANAIRTVSLSKDITLPDKQSKTIHLKADALEWFKTPTIIKIKDIDVVSANSTKIIADNYADMFSIDHID